MSKLALTISATSNYLLRSRIGAVINIVREAAKNSLGLYFDLCIRQYQTGGLVFHIPKHLTSRSLRGKFVVDTYELAERTLIARHLSPQSRVLELGGSLGIVSCVVNKKLVQPKFHVVLEPCADLVPWIARNREQNTCVFAIENKVVARGGKVFLDKSRGSDGGQIVAGGNHAGVEAIDTITWDALEKKYGITFDTLVSDIEGAEYALMTDFTSDIHALKTVIIEMHPHFMGKEKYEQICQILNDGKFRRIDKLLDTEVWIRD
jgi:FkbM family methyltransferase